jgi:enoyl-CoA hydratase/carnithine racemase
MNASDGVRLVRSATAAGVAQIALDRPEARNALNTADRKEGVAAFTRKRKPQWPGA